jgi:hypothetical protein
MKKFLINLWAYNYHAKFEVSAEDNALSIEKAILDKIGEKSIKWEYMGDMYNAHTKRITYEEVIDDTRTIQYKTVLGVRVATGAPEGGQV